MSDCALCDVANRVRLPGCVLLRDECLCGCEASVLLRGCVDVANRDAQSADLLLLLEEEEESSEVY